MVKRKFNLFRSIRRLISPSYKKASDMRLVGYGEIPWQLIGTDGKPSARQFSVQFYENTLGERDHIVHGEDFEVKHFWPQTKAYHHVKLWLSSGIRPPWFQDILQKKMMS